MLDLRFRIENSDALAGAAQACISLSVMLLLNFAWSFRGWHVAF